MRITSDIWVHVFIRKENNRGAFATILNKGATEAGTIYIIENHLDNTYSLYGPAPQSLIERDDEDRLFERIHQHDEEVKVQEYLQRQRNFDPDIWIIETECKSGTPDISIAED